MGWNSIILPRFGTHHSLYTEVLEPFFAKELGSFRQHWKSSDVVWPHDTHPTSEKFFMEIQNELESIIHSLKKIQFLLSEENPEYRGMVGQDRGMRQFIQKLELEEVRLG